ncbi:hypothetical protein JCM8547_000562 [Rhodosporidiobolus lusitaniae]
MNSHADGAKSRWGCQSKKLSLAPSDTMSSSSSETPSSPKSTSSRFSFSSLHQAVARGHSHSSSSSKSSEPVPYALTVPDDPVHLVETALSIVLSVPGPSLDQLRTELIPKLYHRAYSHRVNCREHGTEELLTLAKRFRERFQSVRIRFRSHLMDMDGSATMEAAAVALTYDIICRPHPSPGESKHDVHELRGSAVGVHKIYEGRLAQTDLVVDTAEFQTGHKGPDLNCSIM